MLLRVCSRSRVFFKFTSGLSFPYSNARFFSTSVRLFAPRRKPKSTGQPPSDEPVVVEEGIKEKTISVVDELADRAGELSSGVATAVPAVNKRVSSRRPRNSSGGKAKEESQVGAAGSSDASSEVRIQKVKIDTRLLVEEWNAVCADASLEDSEKGCEAQQVESKVVTPPARGSTGVKGPGTIKIATIGACIARAVKYRERYPSLHLILRACEEKCLTREGVIVHGAAETARNVEQLQALMAFLRVYRTSTFCNTVVYQEVMEKLLDCVITWQGEVTGARAREQQRDAAAAIKKAVLWVSLELRQNQLEAKPSTKAPPTGGVEKKRKVAAKKNADGENSKWIGDVTLRLVDELVVPAASGVVEANRIDEPHSLSDVVVDLAVLFLAISIANDHDHISARTKKSWEDCTSQIQSAAIKRVNSAVTEKLQRISVGDIHMLAFDLLNGLFVLNGASAALPPPVRDRLKHDMTDSFQHLCLGVGTRPLMFIDVLCKSDVARVVQSLPSQDLCDSTRAAVVTAAALFCERADESAVKKLSCKLTKERREFTRNGACDSSGVFSGDNPSGPALIHHAEPRSRRAKVAFGLFAAGYCPEAVLSSGLCVGHSAVEVLEVLYAASLFSRSFALDPLPARISTMLTSECASLIEARIRADTRAGMTPLETLEEPKAIRDLLERGRNGDGEAPNTSKRQRQRGGAAANVTKANSVPLETVLHLAFSTSVELLVRGEEKKLSAHLVSMLALLEREGSYYYLSDGLTVLIDMFVERYQLAGCYQPLTQRESSNATLPDVESSLSEVTALFVPRVVECALRQLSWAKRSSAMGTAECEAAKKLLQGVHNFTVYAASCGMDATVAKQLVGLHSTVVKSLLCSGGAEGDGPSLFETVNRMDELVTHVGAKQRDLARVRLPGSSWQRYCSIVVNDVVAAHLKPVAAAIRRGGSNAVMTQNPSHVLSLVNLLFRLVSEFTIESEPAELQAFRTDVLDPALTRFLQQQNSEEERSKDALRLQALSEMTVVMCTPHTIHHLSPQLLSQLATAVRVAVMEERCATETEDGARRRHLSKIAARLLTSAAAVCQLRKENLTGLYLEMVMAVSPLLLAGDVSAVLRSFVNYHVPTDTETVRSLRNLLAEEAASLSSSFSLQETTSALQTLCELDDGGQFSYAAILRRVTNSGHILTPGEAGIVVRIATKLQRLGGSLPAEDLAFLVDLPSSLAGSVLRARQQCPSSDVPLVLKGFSQLDKDVYGELRDRVMKAYILRTIQTRQLFSAEEVVDCIESYATAQITHQYLFGVLLARVADVKLKFSLPLAVRLVMCGVNAAWDKSVQTACLTAAQPVFLGLVRHLLQSDPASLSLVAGNAVLVLQCLTEAFPNDPTCHLVLQNMAEHHTALSMSTMMAVLQLIARKNSTEYNILRCMTDHAASVLFPQAPPQAFAELTRLFVQCGVRSKTLFDAVGKRFKEIVDDCSISDLVTLAEAFTVAHVDLEDGVISMMTSRTVELAKQPGVFFKLLQYISLLKFFSLVHTEPATKATTLLLTSAASALRELGGISSDVSTLTPVDIHVFLSSSIRTHPSHDVTLVEKCADILYAVITSESAGEGAEKTATSSWKADLLLIVELASHLVKLGLPTHPVVPVLLELLYERRSALMRRRLLLQTATDVVQAAGAQAHQQLYALLVEGKLAA
ncbi:uncharacterized protein TEOVI_000771000 [Trypanosoma equiperdum]|uniref:Uncharacterized protein n=1 Tax=Trypanosoma equiperdum TaxID=5694 RepID=A0A1G4I629_TRYEQ|nr:hypothetical protein, conserved [Trypanosoma equiperdum]